VLNENVMAEKQPNPGQLKLSSGMPVRKIPTIVFTPVKPATPVKIQTLKKQQQQKQKPQEVQNQIQLKKQQDGANTMKILECSNVQYVYYIITLFYRYY